MGGGCRVRQWVGAGALKQHFCFRFQAAIAGFVPAQYVQGVLCNSGDNADMEQAAMWYNNLYSPESQFIKV